MANAEVECIVRDTRELMFHIGSGEKRVDEMIRRVNAVNEKMTCMREYQNIINTINAFTVNGSRRAVLLEELQRENRQILAYHEENRNLREAINESLETLSIVMNKHRNVMARLNRISKQPTLSDLMKLYPESYDGTAKDRERFRKLVNDLSRFMKDCEDTSSADVQKLSQLLQENQVLREMLSTAAISTPGIKQTFSKALSIWKAKKQKQGGVLVNSEDENATDDELNKTVFEISGDRKK